MSVDATVISERALLSRLNRKLVREPEPLRVLACRENSRWSSYLGRHYVLDCATNTIHAAGIRLEEWARELKVLRDDERLGA